MVFLAFTVKLPYSSGIHCYKHNILFAFWREDKMAYKKCPRCSLNYIQDTELLCKICLEEVGKAIRANEDDEEEYDICPECGENIIKTGEEMCLQCLVEHMRDEVGAEN